MIEKDLAGMKIVGFSIAGEETVLAVPEYNLCFDAGRAPREMVTLDNLCVTHGHMDHAAGIAYYLSQRGFIGCPPGRVIIHRDLAQAVQRLMDVWSEIEGHYSPGEIIGARALEDVPLRRNLVVRPFDVNHARGSLGFSLIETRHKLKPELAGKTGPQLVALKKQGVAIEDHVEMALVTCTGDTALGRWLDLSFVKQSQRLLVECTFFEADHRSRARQGRHIHVVDLPQVLAAAPEAMVCLTHVSRRTDLRQAKRAVERVVGAADAPRVSFLMDRPFRRRGVEAEVAGSGERHRPAAPRTRPPISERT